MAFMSLELVSKKKQKCELIVPFFSIFLVYLLPILFKEKTYATFLALEESSVVHFLSGQICFTASKAFFRKL